MDRVYICGADDMDEIVQESAERSSWEPEVEDYNLKAKIAKFWEDDHQESHGGFATSGNCLQGNHCFDDSGCCRRTLLSSPGLNLQEVDSRPLLGLTLRKTPSFLSLLEMRLSTPVVPAQVSSDHDRPRTTIDASISQPLSEKLKASNFPITTIKIGAWRSVSRREGDLIAKLYYAKRKLVWEVLDGHLKNKMEILWSDITAIQAVMPHNQPGILQIELDKPPLFFRETTPEPRKHTTWQQASDFTGGQAPRYRRHITIFPPGVLDKHYEKLLQCDQHLLELSQKPFPSQESPYFNGIMQFDISGLSVDFNGLGPRFLPAVVQQNPYPAYPAMSRATPLQPTLNPTMTSNFLHRNERARNCQPVRQAVWDESVHFPRTDVYCEEPLPRPGNPGHNYQLNMVALNEIDKHLLGNSQVVCCDEGALSSQVQSMDSFFNPIHSSNANHYQITDASVGQVMMQQNATDSMPIDWLPSLQGYGDNFVSLANNLQTGGDLFSTLYPNQGVLKKY